MVEPANRRLANWGVLTWVSFLFAGIATTLFFATFDPQELGLLATFPIELDRTGGYSMGFLLFWALLLANNVVVAWLMGQFGKPND